ncbi:polysaccharide deacetylase family protein [Prolixibacter sp. NT017]|uniref:polysaccharide deacetylase family protein n=1 Tax=Prolixibacter sp. NT017 TaxID=2652390 RepID=UPI00127EFD18|nr:polysaccharide deacetylase family protein [Prolixibacter sp. NT017]GET24485.1 carbohydrate deacetylase [Prolixibacter sp. NT017]
MKLTTLLGGLLMLFVSTSGTFAQSTPNLAEKLGYDKNAKLLIIHADDLGLSHSTNAAVISAFEKKGITSGSIMVPCPWFPGIAAFAKNNPKVDIGIHLTLTSEWENFKFGPVTSNDLVPSLQNKEGYFYPTVEAFETNAKPEEVEKEMRAQIDRAIVFGIHPTHLDNHMGSVMVNPAFYQILIKLGHEYRIPVLIPKDMLHAAAPQFLEQIAKENIMVDHLFMLNQAPAEGNWLQPYREFIENMQPGLNQIIVHLAYDNDESRAVMIHHDDFGAKWRQNDYDLMTSDEMKALLEENNIKLVTWRQIQNVMYPDSEQ